MQAPDTQFDYESFLKTVPKLPGVYRMLDDNQVILYVGKARDLSKRLASYFRVPQPHPKTRVLVKQIKHIEYTVTNTENEALILENTLIKAHRPRYNVLFKDDKSYPYIFMSSVHQYPSLSLYRGKKKKKGQFFGPYPSVGAAKQSLHILQKLFKIRSCTESFFQNRSRPCLQYQIKRCSGPCVGYITPEQYQADISHAKLFLEGKSQKIINKLADKMEHCSLQQDYEQAAMYRDQIQSLRKVQEPQYVSSTGTQTNIDILAIVCHEGHYGMHVIFIRQGKIIGNKGFYPKVPAETDLDEVANQCVGHFYLNYSATSGYPKEIICSQKISDKKLLEQAIGEQAGHKIQIKSQVRAERAKWLALAEDNARIGVAAQLQDEDLLARRFSALQKALDLPNTPERIECFDISHTMGEATVAACVVFDENGARRQDYRRYNINNITAGDDYAAMAQVLTRRYSKWLEEKKALPDLILIDGGKGQLSQALTVFSELDVMAPMVIAISKGPERKVGKEVLYINSPQAACQLPEDNLGFHLLQQVRDEAHRFCLTGHRSRRGKKRQQSSLEQIPGIGHSRRRHLLQRFGGLQGVIEASAEELAKTPGISIKMAQKIYQYFHED